MVDQDISTLSSIMPNETNVSMTFNELCYTGPPLEPIPSYVAQIFLMHLYLITSVLSLFGNLIVIIVQMYGSRSSQNIRKYLINLALSDITIGVLCVPFYYSDFVLGYWNYPHWLCPTVHYIQPLCVFITSITLSLIGIERYLFTLHQHTSLYRILQTHSRPILISTWIAGLFYSYCIYGQAEIREHNKNGEIYYECINSSGVSNAQRQTFMVINFVLSFLCPFVMLTFSYCAILKTLLCTQREKVEHFQNEQNCITNISTINNRENFESIQIRLKTIKMLLIVILLYVVCWMPIKIYQFLLEFDILVFCTPTQFYTLISVFVVCHWLATANSFANPIVYACMNASFRNDFCKISRSVILSILSLKSSTLQAESQSAEQMSNNK